MAISLDDQSLLGMLVSFSLRRKSEGKLQLDRVGENHEISVLSNTSHIILRLLTIPASS